MKRALILLGLGVLLANVQAAPPAKQDSLGLASSNGADLARGAWAGTLFLDGVPIRQINLYFNTAVQDPQNQEYPSKASGYFSNDALDGQKRAKAPALPMMARFKKPEGSTVEVDILATFQIPPDEGSGTTMMGLEGQAKLRGSAVTDDSMEGTWFAQAPDGTPVQGYCYWSAKHLDRRNVNAPPVDLTDPTLSFSADVSAFLTGPAPDGSDVRSERMNLGAWSDNIPMDGVRVTCPNGSTIVLPSITDVWLFDVPWLAAFRVGIGLPGLPVAGGRYVFTALDVAGNC